MWRIPRYAGPKSNNLKKLNGHSFLRNPRYHWLSGHCKKFLVLFAQNSIGNCIMSFMTTVLTKYEYRAIKPNIFNNSAVISAKIECKRKK